MAVWKTRDLAKPEAKTEGLIRTSRKNLGKLNAHNIVLVVLERFKSSAYAGYESRANVMTYRSFFDELKSSRAKAWLHAGIDCFGLTTTAGVPPAR